MKGAISSLRLDQFTEDSFRQHVIRQMAILRPIGPVRCPAERHWLYAIQQGDDGPIKLGTAKYPAARLSTLQCGNPETLRPLAAWRALPGQEAALYRLFFPLHIRGEWFRPHPVLTEFVEYEGGDFADWDYQPRNPYLRRSVLP